MKTRRILLLIVPLLSALGVWIWLVRQESSYDQTYNLIEPGLFLGAAMKAPPPGTQAVVNLCSIEDHCGVEAMLWDPVFDGKTEPSLDWLKRVVRFIADQRGAGRTTFVHCQAGMNRSGAAVTAFLMREHRWGRDEALTFVQSKRPIVQPNPTLMKLLNEWERSLKEER